MLLQSALANSFHVMMFTTLGLFQDVDCPERPSCSIPNCVFSHRTICEKISVELTKPESTRDGHKGQVYKKRKITSNETPQPETVQSISPMTRPKNDRTEPVTASRPISPPPSRSTDGYRQTTASAKIAPGKDLTRAQKLPAQVRPVTLNPRMLSNPPAPHPVRMQLIKMLHEQIARLNDELRLSDQPTKTALELGASELILVALKEEERAAKDNPAVYTNVIKLRIMKLKKMKLADWVGERTKLLPKVVTAPEAKLASAAKREVISGLTAIQELAFLPRLVAKQTASLSRHGYVFALPGDEDIQQARLGVESSHGWEQCDRCQTRFQVFPGRRDDGALASGGPCRYHPTKPRRPLPQDKADKTPREPTFGCCSENVGASAGCTSAPSHVYKVSDRKRLALILPFQRTPVNENIKDGQSAVCFDCEMGYTTIGLELIRMTATAWPDGSELIDTLVRPIGEILDLNSRYSGVWPQDFSEALPYEPSTQPMDRREHSPKPSMSIVDSPMAARALLFSHLAPSTPLIGHAIENDLNASRIIHPTIIDTVLLYPHPRGLPIRFGLKMLMKKHLNCDIQMGGEAGHDSKEDAQSAGELVRLRIAETWPRMRSEGWRFEDNILLPPMTRAEAIRAELVRSKDAKSMV